MSLADFFDRIGTNFGNNISDAGPQGLASLGAAIASAPRRQWGAGLAQGLGGMVQMAQNERKKKSLADALQGAMGGVSPEQAAFLKALEPEQQASILGSQLFKEKQGGPFPGQGFEASVANILAKGEADPAFKNTPEYKLAKADWEKPQFVMGPNGPQIFQRGFPLGGTAPTQPAPQPTPQPRPAPATRPLPAVAADPLAPETTTGGPVASMEAPPQSTAPTVTALPGGATITDMGVGAKPTEAQQKAGQFAQEMKFASNVLNDDKQVDEYLGFWNGLTREANADWLQSGEAQRVKSAGQQWVTNMLYMKSGAQAGPAEIANNQQIYIPQWGDKPDVIKYKKAAREMAEAALIGATTPEQKANAKKTVDLITERTKEALGVTKKQFPTPPAEAIARLKMARDKAAFEEVFGPGSADKYLGGK